MEDENSVPNISQYFSNDPPSMFDEIVGGSALQSTINTISTMSLQGSSETRPAIDPIIYMKTDFDDEKIPDEVRDLWPSALTEPGIPPMLTLPGVLYPNDMTDPIREAVKALLDEEELRKRPVLSAGDVTQDERGLKHLIEVGCYRSAVNLTGRLLSIYGQGFGKAGQPAKHSPHSLHLWFTRFALLIKLGEFELCQQESECFGSLNRADMFFEFYPEMYNGRKGSMAAFSFRLLLAEFPLFIGSCKTAIDRLTDLLAVCTEIQEHYETEGEKNETASQFWRRRANRVMHSIVNCSLMMKEYSLADYIMSKLTTQPNLTKQELRPLFSAWGRLYLHFGDTFGAEKKFSEARRLKDSNSSVDLRDLVDKGLVAVAQSNFSEAYGYLQKAIALEPNNIMLLNNMGVCMLYSGRLKEAIELFERAVNTSSRFGFDENLLINLSTLYELESNNSKEKKLWLLRQVNRFKPDIGVSLEYCLKLQISVKEH